MKFLENIQNEKLFIIVSGSLGQSILPLVHNINQLISIYIFCCDQSKHEHWVTKWPKIKGVYTNIVPVCQELKKVIEQCDRDLIPISIVSTNESISTTELNQLDQSFMYTQILKEILFDIDFDKKSIKEFTNYCRKQFINNEKELKIIEQLEKKYSKFEPIWWYTNECFLHRMLNRALRMMEVDIIIQMGFFIRDLHCHIEYLYNKQYKNCSQEPFIVYRGQGLSEQGFNKLRKTKGGLISFNNFLSSSKKSNIGLLYAHRAVKDSGLIGIVFKMFIDPSISSTPFALLNDVSFFKGSEQEILFSMHTIFRIGDINQMKVNDDRLWEVELTLTNDSDQQLNELTQRMREEAQGSKGWFRVGQLLIKLGEYYKAGELYNILLKQTSNKLELSYIYHQLGWIKVNLGNYQEAICFFEKSLIIGTKIHPSYHPDLATCYDNIGLVYDYMGEYIKSLVAHQKALEIYRVTLPSNHPDLATVLNNIGLVYNKLKEYQKALLSHEEALKIYQQTLPSNHSSLAVSYNNIGLVHHNMNDYTKALWFYDKTFEIYRNTLPANHPDLAISLRNTGKALEKMCEYSKALSFYGKALAILQKNFQSDHPHLATCYSSIASVYYNMEQFSDALTYYEKALVIHHKASPPHYRALITLYESIGDACDRTKDYSKALSSYQKALEIGQTIFLVDHNLLASLNYKITKIYHVMDCYSKKFPYVENTGQDALLSNYSDLQTYLNEPEIGNTIF